MPVIELRDLSERASEWIAISFMKWGDDPEWVFLSVVELLADEAEAAGRRLLQLAERQARKAINMVFLNIFSTLRILAQVQR